ncbi:hypothetical protein ABPG77_010926 [Micractinium sp. CCAP 211/92]
MAGGLQKYVAQAMGKASFRDAWKAGGWKMLIDGNLAETLFEHGPGAELVGTDKFGNKYFEKKDAQWVRNRFVVFAGANNWSTQDSSSIPPEWHAWLHYIGDYNPTNTEFKQPIYALEASSHPSVVGPLGPLSATKVHQPKGSWFNPDKLTWRKVQAWEPPKA